MAFWKITYTTGGYGVVRVEAEDEDAARQKFEDGEVTPEKWNAGKKAVPFRDRRDRACRHAQGRCAEGHHGVDGHGQGRFKGDARPSVAVRGHRREVNHNRPALVVAGGLIG
jgi:hypothetical protein